MKCIKCGHENPVTALFCMNCGVKLERKCPRCGAEYLQKALFCVNCGLRLADVAALKPEDIRERFHGMISQESLLTEQQAAGENRPITVLFADMSGFTSMSQKLATETVIEKVNQCFEAVEYAVLRYGGIINRFIGDCVLVFFGARSAHENDPERAIMAAFGIQEALSQLELNISIGINTGNMYFGPIGTQEHLEISAYGTDINLAKRLQEAALPGQILVGENTYRSTRRSFVFQTLYDLHLKGFDEPVSAYAFVDTLPRPEKTRGIEGLRSGLIGRDRELNELRECVDNLLSEGGQLVCVVGDVGVGKSRLAAELKEYIRNKKIRFMEGVCVSIGESIGYSIFINILKDYLGLLEVDTSREIGEKIVSKMKELFPADWEGIASYMGNLLSVKFGNQWDERIRNLPPEQVKYETSLALRDMFLALARQKPLVLILDDIHLADSLSLDLLSLLMDELEHVPLMLLCIYRPEKEHRIRNIETQALSKCPGRYEKVMLWELLPQESRRLLESLLKNEILPEGIKQSILQRTEGNPLFLEEVIRSFIDSGVIYRDGEQWVAKEGSEEITVPNRIQSVIMSRIDRLEDEVQYVLKCASVIGRDFRYKLLQYAVEHAQNLDSCLWQLEERDHIYEERTIPEREYRFKHALIQETLYHSLLSHQIQALHHKVGEGIEELFQDRIEEFYEELAAHYSRSGNLSKAIDYLMKAGNKAKGIYANQQAIVHFRAALGFINQQSEDQERLALEINAQEALGDVLFATGLHNKAELHFKQALDLASRQDDVKHIAILTCKLADSLLWQSSSDKAIEIAESGLAEWGDEIDDPEAANLMEVITRSYWTNWDLESARRYARQNAQIIHNIPYFDSIYKIYYSLALVEILSENFDGAMDWLKEMERICLEHDNRVGLAQYYHGLGDLWWRRNDLRESSRWMEKSLDCCETTGEAHLLLEGHLELATILIILGEDSDHIEEHIQKGMKIADQMAGTSLVASAPEACRMLADAYLKTGNIEQGMAYYRRAIEFGPSLRTLLYLLRDLEELYVKQGQHEAFFDFCRKIRQGSFFQSKQALRNWHLEPGSISPDYSRLVWCDPFEGDALREGWHWMALDDTSSYDLIGQGILEIRTSSEHELFPPNPNAPRLLYKISGDFAIGTTLVDISEEEGQRGGLVLWMSQDMYLRFGKVHPHKNELDFAVSQRGKQELIGRGWFPGNELHLRLECRENSISALCSSDGNEWLSCGEVPFCMDDQIWAGLYVTCPGHLSSSALHFKGVKIFQREAE